MSPDSNGMALPVMEAFYTIQGEGFHSGKPAYFIRLGGCDIGCTWCDVKESWDKERHPLVSIGELCDAVLKTPTRFVVITGGEPSLYDLDPLCRLLHEQGCYIAIETSGAYALKGSIDWVCVSPKKFRAPLPEMLEKAHELKVVIHHASDFDWAEKQAVFVQKDCKLFLQPEYERFHRHIGPLVDYVKQHPRWSISLQTHKIINVP